MREHRQSPIPLEYRILIDLLLKRKEWEGISSWLRVLSFQESQRRTG